MWLRSQELLPRLPTPQTSLIQICSKDFSENIEFCLEMFFYPSVSSKLVFAWFFAEICTLAVYPTSFHCLLLPYLLMRRVKCLPSPSLPSNLELKCTTGAKRWNKLWVANGLWINNENESIFMNPFFFRSKFLGCQDLLCPTCLSQQPSKISDRRVSASISGPIAPFFLQTLVGFTLEARIFLLWGQCKMQWWNLATKCLS